MKNSSRQANGFTLIEIVVTLSLMGILIVLLGLNTNLFADKGLETRQILLSHLQYIKSMAMATQQIVGLEIDTEGKLYRGVRLNPDLDRPDPFQANPLEVKLNIKGIATNLPAGKIFFNSFGQPLNAAGRPLNGKRSIILQLARENQPLFIEPETGYIHP